MENTAMNNCGDTMNLGTPERNEDWLYNDDKVSEYCLQIDNNTYDMSHQR